MFEVKMSGERLLEMFEERRKLIQSAKKLYTKLLKRFDHSRLDTSELHRWSAILQGCQVVDNNLSRVATMIEENEHYDLCLQDLESLGLIDGDESPLRIDMLTFDKNLLTKLKRGFNDADDDSF